MKKLMKLAVISAFLALGITVANASTNVVLATSFALSGFKQVDESTAAPVRITNRDIFADLNSSSNFTFGRSAQLVIVSRDDNGPVFVVRERSGTNITNTQISDVLSVTESDEVVARNGVRYAIITFHYNDNAGTSFDVSGFATLRHGRINGRGIGLLENKVISAAVQVSGTGTIGGSYAVLRGVVSAAGPKAEIED